MSTPSGPRILSIEGLGRLIDALKAQGYRVVGPTRRDSAIVYDDLESADQLPVGWRDVQAPGSYRLEERDDGAVFGFVVGSQSFKKYFQPPTERLFQLRRKEKGWDVIASDDSEPPVALFGARGCEIAAMGVQDRVLMQGPYPDPGYSRRRQGAFIVAVSCIEPAASCFCTSMGGGPRPRAGFDLALTELLPASGHGRHRFYVEVGTARGAELLDCCDSEPATDADRAATERVEKTAEASMSRRMDADGLQALLQNNLEHPRWDDVAERCLTCANCTLVCPTCFCTRTDDLTDLSGEQAERVRTWDSCFSLDYSHMHGGSARTSVKARYRQWLTHKLSTWFDQFGSSGCVGCGRCITWCPAGIDITAEVAAIRATSGKD